MRSRAVVLALLAVAALSPFFVVNPYDSTFGKSAWWAGSIGVAVLLTVATFQALRAARRRPRGNRKPGLGALVGLDVCVAAVGGFLVWPPFLRGDFFPASINFVELGLPMLVAGTAIGAVVGTFVRRSVAWVVLTSMPASLVGGYYASFGWVLMWWLWVG
jgi:hypothetical protein